MFINCSSLTTAPELPATELAECCYRSMFFNCKSLTAAPELPATTLAPECYQNMFGSCSSLEFPADLSQVKTLGDDDEEVGCCQGMYSGCKALKIYEEPQQGTHEIPWKATSADPSSAPTGWAQNMFSGAGASVTVETGKTYYIKGVVPVLEEAPTQVYVKGSSAGLRFRSSANYNTFSCVKVDENVTDASNYDCEVKESPTIVTLKSSYLDTLSSGEHKIAIVSKISGQYLAVDANFTIEENTAAGNQKTGNPGTGITADNTTTTIAAGLLLLAAIAFAGYMVWKKKSAKQDA